VILAELNIRHTRRHQPTRRVALGDHYLPTSGPAYGAVLLGAVVAENLDGLDDEQRDLLPRLLADAEDGLNVPRIALRHRLQTDTHGLDRSRHRIVARPNGDGGDIEVEAWRGVPAERRWAMEVLGVRAGARVDREDVQRRFRRLLRLAHPDHGAADMGAAERIAELAEARELLLAVLDHER
jgi:hypothetical protein